MVWLLPARRPRRDPRRIARFDARLGWHNTHTLLAAARAGAGYAILPRFVARGDDSLVAVSADVSKHPLWLVIHPEFRRDPKVRVTADFLKAAAQTLTEE